MDLGTGRGYATAGDDYASGNISVFVTTSGNDCSHEIQIITDNDDEGIESFQLRLTITSPRNAVLTQPGADVALVRILNDDGKYYMLVY